MLFSDSASLWIYLRPRTENVLIELEAHAHKRSAMGHVLTGQIVIAEAGEVVAAGNPHVGYHAISELRPHFILPRVGGAAEHGAEGCPHVPALAHIPGLTNADQLRCGRG